jgi:lysozyme
VSAVDIALPRIEKEEGFEPQKYIDTEGRATIGYGFQIDAGITQNAALALLQAQLQDIDARLQPFPWYSSLDAVRQSVCIDIAFNAGISGLLRFPKMIAALAVKDWESAADQCAVTNPELASRYHELSQILLSGDP